MVNFTRKVMSIWVVATITTLKDYYNFSILHIAYCNLNDWTIIIYNYIWKIWIYIWKEKSCTSNSGKKNNPETPFVFIHCGMLQRRSCSCHCFDICSSTFQITLKVFSTEGSAEYRSYCRWPVIYLILYWVISCLVRKHVSLCRQPLTG